MPTDWLTFGSSINYGQLILRTIVAVLLGGVIGIDRERKNRPAGMRTHVLVCLGAALIAMVEQQMVANVAALGNPQINVSVGRLTAGVVSGVGFLGAGTIFIADRRVNGLTTAASLWCTACLGLAVGAGYTTMAVFMCVVVMLILRLMQRIVKVNAIKKLEVQFVHRTETLPMLNEFFSSLGVTIIDVDFHAERAKSGNVYTNIYALSIPSHIKYVDLIEALSERPNILTVRLCNV